LTGYNIGILIKALAKGILLFYVCLVLINAVVLLPANYRMTCYLIEDVLLNAPIWGIDGVNSSALFPSLWKGLLAPVFLAILGILILRIIRLKIVGSYFVLISSFCLAALIIGILRQEFSIVSRVCLSAALVVLIVAAVFCTFRRLYRTSNAPPISRLIDFAFSVLLPSAVVILFTGMHMANIWRPANQLLAYLTNGNSPLPPSPSVSMWSWNPILFEMLLWIYLPMILTAALAVLSTTVTFRKPTQT
jgi:hypothetical protein